MDYEKLQAMALVSFLLGNQTVFILRSKEAISRQEAIDLYDRVLLAIDALQEETGAVDGVLEHARRQVEEMIEQCL